jgi:hypothetical protein
MNAELAQYQVPTNGKTRADQVDRDYREAACASPPEEAVDAEDDDGTSSERSTEITR